VPVPPYAISIRLEGDLAKRCFRRILGWVLGYSQEYSSTIAGRNAPSWPTGGPRHLLGTASPLLIGQRNDRPWNSLTSRARRL